MEAALGSYVESILGLQLREIRQSKFSSNGDRMPWTNCVHLIFVLVAS